MNNIAAIIERSAGYVSTIGLADVVDIAIVALLIYWLLSIMSKTNTSNIAKGLAVILAIYIIADVFGLSVISYLIQRAFELGFIALIIIFQPELRRLLERAGSFFSRSLGRNERQVEDSISQTVLACVDMSRTKTGALIIFERDIRLTEIKSTGTVINADVTAELIKNIFFNKAPLHDGAMIISSGRIDSAGCVLPLTKKNLSKELGTRHRAGIGLSEESDAVVVIVSEETGAISVAIAGTLKRHLDGQTLDKILRQELITEEEEIGRMPITEKVKEAFREVTAKAKIDDEQQQ